MDLLLQLAINGIANGSHYALLAIGFGLIFATTGIVHFAYGPLYALSAYFVWMSVAWLGLPFIAALGVAVAASAVVGLLAYLWLHRPFERNQSPAFVVMIVSLGLFIVVENGIGIVFGTDTKVLEEVTYGIHFVGDAVISELQIAQVVALVLIGGALALFLKLTNYGKAVRAMTDNPDMAAVIGIDTVRISVLVFAIGSAIAAVPAVLVLIKDGATPAMGFSAVFVAFVAVIVGGLGSIRGAILGGLLLGMVENLGMWKIPTEWQSSIAFVVLFLVLLLRPNGLFKGQ